MMQICKIVIFNNRILTKSSLQTSHLPNNYSFLLNATTTRFFSILKDTRTILKNEKIMFPSVRVVYKDEKTGESKWQIMTKTEALIFARSKELDLVLVNEVAEPPVCKLEDFGKFVKTIKTKQKELTATQKAKSLKEMYFTAGIAPNDLNIKLKKIKSFLSEGHPVKVSVTIKASGFKKSPTALDETVITILNELENDVSTVHQATNNTNLRRDFTINPKPTKAST